MQSIAQYPDFVDQLSTVLPDNIYILDLPSQSIIYSNREMYVNSGYSSQEIIEMGKNFILKTTHPEDLPEVLKHNKNVRQAEDGQILELEFRFKKKNGEYVWISTREKVFKRDEAGQPSQIIGIAKDIELHKQHELGLLLANETFTSAFNFSAIGMALISPEGKWLNVNDAVCLITGYQRDELMNLTFQDITHPDDLEIDLNYVQKMLEKKIRTYSLEKRYISKNKEIIWIQLTVSMVWNEDGSPKFFISQIADITTRKKLADEISAKNLELETAREGLIQKLKHLEELHQIMAHNLRGPVSNIKMLSQILQKSFKPENAANAAVDDIFTVEEAADMIEESSISLLQNLQDLMEIAQMGMNKEVEFDLCNVKIILSEILQQLSVIIQEKKAVFKINIQVETIHYPKVYLQSILYNLISNALKYSQPEKPVTIHVTVETVNDKTRIIIQDNGLGIDLEKYGSRIFKLNQFFHTGFDSKGIGLYITKTKIESLGGTIQVESKVNDGAKFTVIL